MGRLKSVLRNLVYKSLFLRRVTLLAMNTLKIGENSLIADNIHFQKNNIRMNDGKSQRVVCADTSFLRDCKVLMTGKENVIEVNAETEIYGGRGQTFHVDGNNNHIMIGENSKIRNTTFYIQGSNNTIILEDNISCFGAEFQMRQDGNQLMIGEGTSFHGRDGYPVHIVCDEGSNVIIGEDCMLSKDIQIRSSDSHSIVDLCGNRLNPAEDVCIGDHVWISLGAIILKGTKIPSHTVIAAGAICTKKYTEEYTIIAGNPAKVVKRQIDWDRKFI